MTISSQYLQELLLLLDCKRVNPVLLKLVSSAKEGNTWSVRFTTILLHPLKDNTLRFFKRKVDNGCCLIEVPLASNSSILSTSLKFSGMFLSSDQSDTSSLLRDFKPLTLQGILSRFLQLFMLNTTKPTKQWNNEDSCAIAAPLNLFRSMVIVVLKYFLFRNVLK